MFFAIRGVYFLVKPDKEIVEEEPVVESIYPFEFRASSQITKSIMESAKQNIFCYETKKYRRTKL